MIRIDYMCGFVCLASIISVQCWTSWSAWSPCTASCGSGRQYKYRSCIASSCSGSWTAWRSCVETKCRVNGGWSVWFEWGSCSSSCGGGMRYRSRRCNNPVPNYGGIQCYGSTYENIICNTNRCPVNGQWSMWSNWTICDTTCGKGYQNRSRSCDSPPPNYGGSKCTGSTTEDRQCHIEACPERLIDEEKCCSAGGVAGAVIGSIILTSVVLVLANIVKQRRQGNLDKPQRLSEKRQTDFAQHNPSYNSSVQNVQDLNHEEGTVKTDCDQDVYENLKI